MKGSRVVTVLNVLIIVTLLIGFGALATVLLTAVQSVPSVSVGGITTNVSGMQGTINVPVTITNRGPLALSDVAVQVSVLEQSGIELLKGGGGPVTVAAGATSSLPIAITFDLGSIPKDVLNRLVTNSENLTVRASLVGGVPPFATASGSVSAPLSWGAPVENLVVGTPSVTPLNATKIQVSVPVSFTNANAFVPISGTASIKVTDQSGAQVGQGSLDVSAPTNSAFKGDAKLMVSIPPATLQTLLFNDTTLSYKAAIDFQSGGTSVFSSSQTITFDWKAPLGNLAIGSPSVKPFNSTHLQVTVPVSFENRNDLLDLTTNVKATISNATTNAVLGGGVIGVSAPHNSKFSGDLVTYVAFDRSTLNTLLFNDRVLDLRATLTGSYQTASFSFDKTIALNWGAPLGGFQTGQLSLASLNKTGMTLTVPVSFANHSPLEVSSPITVSISNATSGQTLGSAAIQLNVPSGSSYSKRINVTVSLPSGALNTLLFNDKTLGFNVQIGGSYANFGFSIQKTLSYQWGAPVKSLTLGRFNAQPFNATTMAYSLQFNFTNNSPIRVLTATVTGVVLNQTGSQVGTVNSFQVIAPSQKVFSTQLSGSIDKSAVFQHVFLKLTFQTSFGSVVKEIAINA